MLYTGDESFNLNIDLLETNNKDLLEKIESSSEKLSEIKLKNPIIKPVVVLSVILVISVFLVLMLSLTRHALKKKVSQKEPAK